MKRLLIDKGNTRVKWKLLSGDDWDNSTVMCGELQDFAQWLDANKTPNVQVDVSAVSGHDALLEVLRAIPNAQVNTHQSTAHHDGLLNSYQQPERMGVDRWLAMLGARDLLSKSSFIVIDAGTAFTVDVVVNNQHQGGYILPGVMMATNALYGNTDKVIRYPEVQSGIADHALGNNTVQCVEYGILNQLLALTRQVQQDFPGLPIILTGGDAELFTPYLNETVLAAELVLQGLFVIGKE